MTREDIIKMAQEAGLGYTGVRGGFIFFQPGTDGLERFAALVAAAERNKVAQWMIDRSYATGHGDTVEDLLKELAQSVREEERELCAQMCEEEIQRVKPIYSVVAENALNAILALRAAIEQRKPVAWRKNYQNSGYTYFDERWGTIPDDAEPLFSN